MTSSNDHVSAPEEVVAPAFDEHNYDDGTLAAEVPAEEDKPTEEVVKNKIVMDGRMVFYPNDKVDMSPYLANNLSSVSFNGKNLLKCYPDPENDPVDGLASFVAGWSHNTQMSMYRDTLENLSNVISYAGEDGTQRRTAITIPKPPLNGTKLASEDAVLAITSALGIGGKIQIPLVSSGFRIEIERPTGDDIALLDEYLLRNKGEFGRFTLGGSMTYSSCYLERDIVNLALRKIVRTNLATSVSAEALRKRIKQDDYPTITLGLMAAILPEGYDVNVPCLSSVSTCNHIQTGKISPARMFNVDHRLLTNRQLEIITRPINESVSLDDYDEYAAEFGKLTDVKTSYEFVQGDYTYRFIYKRPSIEEFISGGISWAKGINDIITTAMKGGDASVVHKRMLRRQFNLNTISQFAAWFGAVEIVNAEGKVLAAVTDDSNILDLLKRIIVADQVHDVFEDVNRFIFNQNPTVIGVPNINCPVCKKPISEDNTVVVPQDIDMVFFTRISDQAVFDAIIGNMALLE